MCLVLIANGRVLPPYWFVNDGKPYNVNAASYIEAIENHFLPEFSQRELAENWWQQDGLYINLYLFQ